MKSIKKRMSMAIGVLMFLVLTCSLTYAGEMDVLLKKLVEKGILTESEATEVLAEAKEEIKKELAAGTADTAPKWTQKIELKGDLRVRYQHEQGQLPNDNKDRGRYRFRLGATAFVTEDFEVKAGIASGDNNPRSTNQSFQDNFSHPDIRLDYAYAEYAPSAPGWDFLTVKGGKIRETPWWHPSDLLWDSDINPEGGSLEMSRNGLTEDEDLDLFFNTGIFVLEDFISNAVDSDDPYMYVVQPGFNWNITDSVHWKNAVTYYGFEEQKHWIYFTAPGAGRTNSTTTGAAGGVALYDYDSVAVGSELSFDKLFSENWPRIALLGEFINSFDPGSRNNGWLAGLKVGKEKVKKKRDWQLYYNYRFLEQDAWLDIFPDADFYTGATDVKGHRVTMEYGLFDNVNLGLNYIYAEPISNGSRNPTFTPAFGPEHLVQADVTLKY